MFTGVGKLKYVVYHNLLQLEQITQQQRQKNNMKKKKRTNGNKAGMS